MQCTLRPKALQESQDCLQMRFFLSSGEECPKICWYKLILSVGLFLITSFPLLTDRGIKVHYSSLLP